MTQQAKNNLVNISIQRVASVDKAANRRTWALIKRAQEPPSSAPSPTLPPVDSPFRPEGDAVTKTAETKPDLIGLTPEQKAYVEKLEKGQKPETPAEPVDLSKAEDYVAEIRKMDLPEATKDYLIKSEGERREDRRIAKQERDARRRSEHIAKAQTDYGLLNKSAEGLGELMMKLEDQCDDATYKQVTGVLKSASAIAKSGEIFKELGDGGDTASGSASEQVEEAAQELRKSDKTLSLAAARQKAAEADPELKKRWQEELSQSR